MRPKRIPSWRQRGMQPETLPSTRPAGTGGVLYVGANNCIKCGDFLGDTITQVIAQSIIWETIHPDRTIISLYRDNPLNFLWDRYIARTMAQVIYDPPINGDIGAKYAMLDARRRDRAVESIAFDHYRECYRCMDMTTRTAALGAPNASKSISIIEIYFYGQEASHPLPYWSSGPHYFGFPRRGPGEYVLISPLEKCQNNMHFSFPMWRKVIEILLAKSIPVVLNERSKFCSDLRMVKTFEPFPKLMEQVSGAAVVACGNTGTMWAAAACGTPSVICESPGVAMPMYTAHRGRLAGLRFVCPDPDPAHIAQCIETAWQEAGGIA
jgi:hypothetical protein